MKKTLVGLCFLLINTGTFQTVFAASFPCEKARSTQEKLICSTPDLSRFDSELAEAYQAILGLSEQKEQLREQQRTWIKSERDRCTDSKCLIDTYRARLGSLLGQIVTKEIHEKDFEITLPLGGVRYLVSVSNAPRASQGLYHLNLNTGKVTRLLGGFPNIGNTGFLRDGSQWILLQSRGMNKGGMWNGYGILIVSAKDKSAEPSVHNILSVVEDGESGMCGGSPGRAQAIGLEKAGEILEHKLISDGSSGIPQFIFKIREQDCKTRQEKTYSKKYVYADGKFREQSQ